MPLDENVIRQITERVTREVLAALHETDDVIQDVDTWPDWDEFAFREAEDKANDARIAPAEADDYEVDMPLPVSVPSAGFSPTSDWLAAQLQKDGYLRTGAPAHAYEAWEQ